MPVPFVSPPASVLYMNYPPISTLGILYLGLWSQGVMIFQILNLGVKMSGFESWISKQLPGCLTMHKFLIFLMFQFLPCKMGIMIRFTSYSCCEVCIKKKCLKDLAFSILTALLPINFATMRGHLTFLCLILPICKGGQWYKKIPKQTNKKLYNAVLIVKYVHMYKIFQRVLDTL